MNRQAQPETTAPAAVELADISKVFRDFWLRPKVRAVDALSLTIPQGELFGLLGPNGSGKSTTIKIILGLLHPTAGTLRVLGRPPGDVTAKRRIGYLPEESHLYGYLTARETLDFYARLFGLSSETRRTRTAQLLETVGLTQAADRAVGEFSKGMARRIGLAQALINDPDFLILDEPTAGLDPIGCRQVKDLLLRLAGRGKTILLSSHLLSDVEDVCGRVAILHSGRLRAEGRVRDLLEKRDRLRLAMPAPTPAITREIVAFVRERTGFEPLVDHPAMNLEEFFLKTIEPHEPDAAKAPAPGPPP